MKTVLLAVCIGAMFAWPSAASAQDRLAVSRPVARSIGTGATQTFLVDLNGGDRAGVTITHKGRITVDVHFPDGQLMRRLTSSAAGEQDVVIDAEKAGAYRIDVTAVQAARYEIVMDGVSTAAQRQQARQPANDSESRNQPVNGDDLAILRRADAILASSAVWNRHDTRICLPGEKTFSLFCALERAQIDLFGEYRHRAVALQEVRFAIEDVTGGQKFEHRLMDYNNLPSTGFADVKRVLTIAAQRVRVRLSAQEKVVAPQR